MKFLFIKHWYNQWRYAWADTLNNMWFYPWSTLFTVLVISISLTLPSLSYLIWKNISQFINHWNPQPQLTIYLNKKLNNYSIHKIITILKQEPNICNIKYISKEQAMNEFRKWSGLGKEIDILGENPLPNSIIIIPKKNYDNPSNLHNLRNHISGIYGVEEIYMDNSWFVHLKIIIKIIGKLSAVMGILMIVLVFLVISNSIRLNVSSQLNTINIMKLIGATDIFILRPFLNGGALIGFSGALLSIILSVILANYLKIIITKITIIFNIKFVIYGFDYNEVILLMLISTIVGWFAACITTIQYLRQFTLY